MSIEDNTLKYYIWGYQRHFHSSAQRAAEKLFKLLDPEFEVEVKIIGFIRKESETMHPVCLEPEHGEWVPSDFLDFRKNAAHFLAVDGDQNLMSTTEQGMAAISRRRHRRAEHAAMVSILNRWKKKPDTDYYFSGLIAVGHYDVGVILSVAHLSGAQHYKLPKINSEEHYSPPSSLIEGVASKFLETCLRSLHVPSPELVTSVKSNNEEILSSAARDLMDAPIVAAHSFEGHYGLFDVCNYIASLYYEGIASSGGLIVARRDHPNIAVAITLESSIPLSSHRSIRKLLEVSATGESLISNGDELVGFGRIVGTYDESKADLFQIRFTGHHKWELLHKEHKMMKVEYGVPSLPIPPLIESRFLAAFEILFGKGNTKGRDLAYKLSLEACRQRHGTILVITPEAQKEIKRLSTQATAVVPFAMTSEILKSVTSIDGAVLLDTNAMCHAIGVILDGIAIPRGDPARGARYNSALRYMVALDKRGLRCLMVIVSEDGTSELLPNFPRRIRKSLLDEKEEALDALLAEEEWSLDKSFPLLNWFASHRFYLSKELCDKANRLLQNHDSALNKNGLMRVQRSSFEPSEAMSDAFFE